MRQEQQYHTLLGVLFHSQVSVTLVCSTAVSPTGMVILSAKCKLRMGDARMEGLGRRYTIATHAVAV